ncbi:MAG: acyl-CoA desaturase, partial [Solirubrobacterales bacterium]|nr:acyl-CoA desaturase [Solirubrobacterales bacterium]
MTRRHRVANLLGVIVPALGFLAAVILLWRGFGGWRQLALMGALYLLTGIGLTVGFHRLLAHRAFATCGWMRCAFAVLGSMAVEGPVISWVANHRKHHTYADQPGAPHSPHLSDG